jgi:membrane associated rhomboid family serine protease
MAQSIIRRPFQYRFYNASLYIIGLNILVFFLTMVNPRLTWYLSLQPLMIIKYKAVWQFVTYMFTHGGISHILFNMLGIFFFGTAVERRMGSSEFLLFYAISGIGAGLFSFLVYILTGSYNVILLGASGAVYSLLLAYATYFPQSRIYLFGMFPVRAPILVAGYAVIEVFSQLTSFRSGVAHLTHLAGFGFAFLYFIARLGINPVSVFRGRDRGDGTGYWR